MPTAHFFRKRASEPLKTFGRNQEGSTAIEFVALAMPFALLIFAILESCVSFAGQQVMSNVTDDIARQLRTGQLRPAAVSQTSLKTTICDRLTVVATDCQNNLLVDLRQFATFADAAKVKINFTSDNDIDTTGFAVSPGKSMSKNMLRVFYKWPVMTDLMRKSMSNLKDGKTLHFATATWQNEPFDD